MNSPLISIITPTYNHSAFIAQCIESVQAQIYDSWEMIIVDDGSHDHTVEIARSFSNSDNRIRLVEQTHVGPTRLSETYNKALQLAKGSWIAVLEGDDYWLPTKLERQVRMIGPKLIVIYSSYLDLVNGVIRPAPQPPFEGSISTTEFARHLLLNRSHMLAVTQLFRREALERIGGFLQTGSPAAVDMATMLELVRLEGEIVYVPEPLGVWRHHSQQNTNLRGLDLAIFNKYLVLNYYDALEPWEKESLQIERSQIVRARRAYVASAAFSLLRHKLMNRDREDVYRLARHTWQYGGLKRKLQAIYGFAALIGGFDFEPVLRLVEKTKMHGKADALSNLGGEI